MNFYVLAPQNDQLDNNLPLAPYKNKLARLNIECSDPALTKDCIPGQKWKCINEAGRWRKHKCKFHLQLQDHLAQINKLLSAQQSKRNCACFTPNGVVYTKIKSEQNLFQKTKRVDPKQRLHNGRHKRDIDYNEDENYETIMSPLMLDLLKIDKTLENMLNFYGNKTEQKEHSRNKRESDYITSTIDELHAVLEKIEKKYNSQKYAFNSTTGPAQCFVEPTGKVNCSTIVYEDEHAWKQSRVQIDMLMKVLKNKINNLKDIKNHLKKNRPLNAKEDDEDLIDSSSIEENLEKSEEVLEKVEESLKPLKKRTSKTTTHPHRHQGNGHSKRKHKNNTSTEDNVYYTTENLEFSTSAAITEATTEESLLISTASVTSSTRQSNQRHKQKTKASRTTTTSTTPETSPFSITPEFTEDVMNFSTSTTENIEDFSVSDLSENSPLLELTTVEAIRTTTTIKDIDFNAASVSVDATIIEPKPRHHKHRQNVYGNSVNQNNLTHEYPQYHHQHNRHSNRKQDTLPADCYCEPEVER